MMKLKHLKLQTTMMLLVSTVIIVVLLIASIFVGHEAVELTENGLKSKVMTVARSTAVCPTVINGLTGKEPASSIQPFANKLKKASDVEFIVVADMKGYRKSHPDPSEINKQIVGGDFEKALHGKEYISFSKGTLGKSLRAFVPIYDYNGRQIGLVLVGILMNNVDTAIRRSILSLIPGILFGLLLGLACAVLLAKKIKKILLGMEPREIAKLLKQRSAMLKSVREGILAIDKNGIINLVNTESLKIFKKAGISENPIGKPVISTIPNTRLDKILKSGEMELDRHQDLNGITLITNRIPIIINNKIEGAIATFRDMTDIKVMAERITGIKLYADSLRAQTHEFMNKLHVILGMIQLKCYDDLSDYIKSIAGDYQIEVGSVIRTIKDKAFAGFILGKMSYCRENKTNMLLSKESYVPEPLDPNISHELITITGNLIDNAIDAVKNSENKLVYIDFTYRNDILYIKVCDTGPCISEETKKKMFQQGFSTKGSNRGFGLSIVNSSLRRLNGRIDAASDKKYGAIFNVTIPYKSKDDEI